jgi:transposase
MLALAPHVRIFIACGVTDMRKGFDGLAGRIEHDLKADPYGGALYIFRGRRGDIVKALYWDGQGLVLYAKRLEKGRFTWPQAKDGVISLTTAQLSMLTEGIDWRMPRWSARPTPEHDA